MKTDNKQVSFKDITIELSDGLHAAPKFYPDGDYIFVNAKNIVNGKIVDVDPNKKTSYEEYLKYKIDLNEHTVLYSIDGTIGNVAKYRGEKVVLGKGACYLKLKPEADTDYIFFYLQSPKFWDYIRAMSTGSTIKHISLKTMRNHTFCLPDMSTQRKIASVLSSLQKKTDINEKINENLTEQTRSIFRSWFVDYEPFGGTVPSDWKPTTLGQIAEMKTDSWSPAKNPDVVVEHYSIPTYDEQRYPVYETASDIKSNKYILTPDSVMISKLNPDTKRIWRPLCLSEHPVCSTEFIVYEAKKKGQRDYIYSLIDSNPFFHHLCSHTTGSTNSRQRATPKSTLEFSVFLPPDSVIEDFCKIVTPMYDLIASNTVENQALAKTRDSLLPRLMSGELDVSELDI